MVAEILADPELVAGWCDELDAMRQRLNALRAALAAAHPRLAHVGEGRGMFAQLPLSPERIAELREAEGLYIAPGGRINIAGMKAEDVSRVARSVD